MAALRPGAARLIAPWIRSKTSKVGRSGQRTAMRYGASTFIWVSPFSNKTLDLLDKAKAFGFDILEICVEDPDSLDPASIRARADKAGVALTICGAFGPSRDLSSEDAAVRQNGLAYLQRCIDFAGLLGSPFVSGPMYA